MTFFGLSFLFVQLYMKRFGFIESFAIHIRLAYGFIAYTLNIREHQLNMKREKQN